MSRIRFGVGCDVSEADSHPRRERSDLEQAVESLSELLERPLEEDKIAELRQQTTDKTVYVAKRCKILLDDTLRGYEEDRWIWQEPIRL